MLAYEENRNFYRMLINSQCKIVLDGEVLFGTCKDLSATGMAFQVSSKAIPLGTILDIEIDSQNREIPSLSVNAEVAREPIAQEGGYLIGVKFHKMN